MKKRMTISLGWLLVLCMLLSVCTASAQPIQNRQPWLYGAEETDGDVILAGHRGYHETAKENTVAAFLAAAEAGFSWVELDIRVTGDGVMVLSHNDEVNMYDHGAPVHFIFYHSNYDDVKDYTWDEEGKYPLATLPEALEALKPLDMTIIFDLKYGRREDAFQAAIDAGLEDRIYLSFGSTESAMSWADILKQHSTTGVRLIPTDYAGTKLLMETLPNPIIADVNAKLVLRDDTHKLALSNSLAANLPMMMSGCDWNNQAVWSVVPGGVMANDELNLTVDQFREALTYDKTAPCKLEAAVMQGELKIGEQVISGVKSDRTDAAGYIYVYSKDPTIVTIRQQTFGNDASFLAEGIAPGTTEIRAFTGSGAFVDIPVTVLNQIADPTEGA